MLNLAVLFQRKQLWNRSFRYPSIGTPPKPHLGGNRGIWCNLLPNSLRPWPLGWVAMQPHGAAQGPQAGPHLPWWVGAYVVQQLQLYWHIATTRATLGRLVPTPQGTPWCLPICWVPTLPGDPADPGAKGLVAGGRCSAQWHWPCGWGSPLTPIQYTMSIPFGERTKLHG